MKLVTPLKNRWKLDQEYVAGKCNIGIRGRVMRLSTGLVVVSLALFVGFTIFRAVFWALRLVLAVPFYVGLLAVLEAGMSFCVFHAARGTFDLHEKFGPVRGSETRGKVELDEWRKLDRRKARRMHVEALAGAMVLALVMLLV